jgi:hypothetical protein
MMPIHFHTIQLRYISSSLCTPSDISQYWRLQQDDLFEEDPYLTMMRKSLDILGNLASKHKREIYFLQRFRHTHY